MTSKYIIHVEFFIENYKNRVRYSLSTKIADGLASGALMIAFGPSDVASIKYLEDNDAAFVISSKEKIEKRINELLSNNTNIDKIINNAKNLAKTNHSVESNTNKLDSIIDNILKENDKIK